MEKNSFKELPYNFWKKSNFPQIENIFYLLLKRKINLESGNLVILSCI